MKRKPKPKTQQVTADTPVTAGNLLASLTIALHDVNRELAGWRAFGAFVKANPDIEERLAKWQEEQKP